ncbi:MAG: nucleotide exchange factor GrpE [Acidiferrobacterales bacterium]
MTRKVPVESDYPADASTDANRTAPAPSAENAPEIASLMAELDAARSQATENMDRFLRAKAETENVRRRSEGDVANAHKYGIERFALEMLAVKDSLERARTVDLTKNTEGDAGQLVVQKMLEGLELTLKLMDNIFQKFALTIVDPKKGDKFDPERHQAMTMVESDDVPVNHVVTTVQHGYLLHDRLLRPAMVVVAKARQT